MICCCFTISALFKELLLTMMPTPQDLMDNSLFQPPCIIKLL